MLCLEVMAQQKAKVKQIQKEDIMAKTRNKSCGTNRNMRLCNGGIAHSKSLCCLLFYALVLQFIVQAFGQRFAWDCSWKYMANALKKVVQQDGGSFLFGIAALGFYTKIFIDDFKEENGLCAEERKTRRDSFSRTLSWYCFAWISFSFQAAVVYKSLEWSSTMFIVGVIMLTKGLWGEDDSRYRILVNVACGVTCLLGILHSPFWFFGMMVIVSVDFLLGKHLQKWIALK